MSEVQDQVGAEQTLRQGHLRRAGLVRYAAVAVAGVVLVAGCTARDTPDPAGPSPTQAPPVSPSPEPSRPAAEGLDVEFKYEAPERPCPPVAELPTLALATVPYALVSASLYDELQFDETMAHVFVICFYKPAAELDDEDVVIPDDHLWFRARMSLWRDWGVGDWGGAAYVFSATELPLSSNHPDDWRSVGLHLRDRGVWREGCGPDLTLCGEDEDPTIQTYEWEVTADGHVGSLHTTLESRYLAQDLPPEAAQTITNLYREFMLAIVDSWEHAD